MQNITIVNQIMKYMEDGNDEKEKIDVVNFRCFIFKLRIS